MIVFDLACEALGHRFEGWFQSSAEFARQRDAGLIACPACGSAEVAKAVMAPAIGRKGNQAAGVPATAPRQPAPSSMPMPPAAMQALHKLAAAQARALRSSRWVGESFADDARAIHYGERAHETIHGQATRDEAIALHEEGIGIAPLLFPVVPRGEAN